MTFKELFSLTLKHIYAFRVQLSKALLFPFILSILLEVLSLAWSNLFFGIIFSILSLMLRTIFAITTHRMILLGLSHVPEWGIIKWSRRETVFMLHALVLALALIVLLFTIFIIQFLFRHISLVVEIICMVLSIIYVVFIFTRLSLVFPAIAIGDACTFKNSWFFTKDYQKLMFFSTILIPLIVLIPEILIGYIPHTFLIVTVLSNLTVIIGVTSLSLSYKFIKETALNS